MKTKFEYEAYVYDAYDGDTFRASVDLGFGNTTNQIFRLFGVDTPEMRGEERRQGIIVRDYVRFLILNKEVVIITHRDKTGKYGRYLAEVQFLDASGARTDLASHLLQNGMAVKVNY